MGIDINDIPGYREGYANAQSEDMLSVMKLEPYEAISFPCTWDHQGAEKKGRARCKGQASVKYKTRRYFDREAVREHGRPWPSGTTPLWVECWDKTIYVFLKPWGSKLGNSAHPIDYANARDLAGAEQDQVFEVKES